MLQFPLLGYVSHLLWLTHHVRPRNASSKIQDPRFRMAFHFRGSYHCWYVFSIQLTRRCLLRSIAAPSLFRQLHLLLTLRRRKRPKLRIRGRFAPTVDVFITCLNEDLNIVLDTTRAACAVDYPLDRFRVVVLDDGANPVLKYAIENLKSEHHNLYYYARMNIDSIPVGGKSGNLNAGSEFVRILEGGAGEFIAVLDANMIPEETWLSAIVPHFIGWSRMALVSPPKVCTVPSFSKHAILKGTKLFYNVPTNDPLAQNPNYSAYITALSGDAFGITLCTGSGYIIRRSALEVIGGWPADSLADDKVLSLRLVGAGWRTAYIHEELQYGTVLVNFHEHIEQHSRRAIGAFCTTWNHRFFLFGPLVRRLTFLQRIASFITGVDAFLHILLIAALLIIPSVFISGGTVVAYARNDQLRWLIRLCFISLITARLQEWTTILPSGSCSAESEASARLWMTPYTIIALIRFLIPYRSRNKIESEPTSKGRDHETPLYTCLRTILYDDKVYIHILYLLYLFLAIEATLTRTFETGSKQSGLNYLLTHMFFPPVLWFSITLALLVPIRYALWPPSMPAREELLEKSGKKGVFRPKRVWRKRRWRRRWVSVIGSEVGLAVTTVLFLGTFFY
jgi:cellulose synthase/poly-beta-1,6-N-acetylglucosamine synthase-like glycosyltransferase